MPVASSSFAAILDPYRLQIDNLIQADLPSFGPETKLKEACEYALLNGGKRFRPALVLMIAKALGYQADASQAALSVEYFHTASLIADDLPCMDDDELRRNKPSLHKVFGESVALLSTYSLISAGYAAIMNNAAALAGTCHPFAHQSHQICVAALENASLNTGILGATGGQFLDLHAQDRSLATIQEIIDKKTVTLFEISFVFGWLFGGGDIQMLAAVKKWAAHFGRAFQIADDLGDQMQDQSKDAVNLANAMGKDQAIALFNQELQAFKDMAKTLNCVFHELEALSDLLVEQLTNL